MMEKMPSRTIEVTVISAEGLVERRKQRVKKNAFVVVRSDPYNSRSTGMDKEGGSYPAWNEKLVMELPANARFLTVEAHSGSRTVGAANIPVSDFVGGSLPLNYLSFLSYRLRDANGDKNGIVNLSIKVKGVAPIAGSGQPWAGVPVVDAHSGVVIGVPVSYRSYNY